MIGDRIQIQNFGPVLVLLLSLTSCSSHNGIKTDETVLKHDLYLMRSAIDQYTEDKEQAPQHLIDLVKSGYLHAIPEDPFTKSNTTWVEVAEGPEEISNPDHPGIADVHSGSHKLSSEGTTYDSW
ncbi:MAG TPA: hypothetical protein VE133_06040 [Candidatus Sulfotelmatobacter sp.]|nr:hypothetical protein [Candidatus Sulfotelmatobacter sp.]